MGGILEVWEGGGRVSGRRGECQEGGHLKRSCPILCRLWFFPEFFFVHHISVLLLLLTLHPPKEDVNVSAVVAAVVVVALVVAVCSCGGFLLHRNGFFSREFPFSCCFPSADEHKIQLFFLKVRLCLTELFSLFIFLFLFFFFLLFFSFSFSSSTPSSVLNAPVRQQDTEEGKSSVIALTSNVHPKEKPG